MMKTSNKTKGKIPVKTTWYKDQWIIGILVVLVVTFILFSPALKNGFTNWDDDLYVTKNKTITSISIEDLSKFGENFVGNFHPLTMISLALDYHFWGLNPFYFHLKNIIFHLINTLLVFLLVKRISRNNLFISLFTALLFGIHPMHVESVAWVAERKDVLYSFYFLTGLLFYYKYLDNRKIILLLAASASFVLSALSKSAAVVFPVVLLLIDYFEERKFTLKSVGEKIPLFIFSVYIGLIALRTQSESNAIGDFQFFSIFEKFRFAAYGFISYLFKFLVPFNLSSFHPYPDKNNLPPEFNIALIAFLALAVYFIFQGRKKKWLLFGFAFYFITIALVLQFISVGNAVVAERYTYLPYIGIGFIYATIIQSLNNNPAFRKYKYIVSAIVIFQLIYFAGTTYSRTKVWKDSATLWTDVIEKYPNESGAYSNRGHYYRTLNNYKQALLDYNMAIKLDDKNHRAYSNRGKVWFDNGQIDKALEDYTKSIEIKPDNAETLSNRGAAYGAKQQYGEALKDLNRALEIDPKNTGALSNRGMVYYQQGAYPKTIEDYNRYLQIMPNDADIINTIGLCYFSLNDLDKALAEFSRAINLNPKQGAFYLNRSLVYNRKNDKANAMNDATKAQQLGFNVSPAYFEQLKLKS